MFKSKADLKFEFGILLSDVLFRMQVFSFISKLKVLIKRF